MRIALALALMQALSSPVWSQSDEEKRDAKLKESWLAEKSPWITDFDKAREAAKKTNRLIFAYFTRSYAF